MLASDALLNHAKERGMPGLKMRGVLREYLQILILKWLYRLEVGKKFAFTGGTYLRLVHETKRFSEDLDFNAKGLSQRDFERAVTKVKELLAKEGVPAFIEFDHWQNLWVSRIMFPEIEDHYGIQTRRGKKEGLMIKLEVNCPQWAITSETLMVRGFGEMYPVICSHKGALFADKIDALVKKNRPRHLYDMMFMLGENYPIDEKVWKFFNPDQAPLEALEARVASASNDELAAWAESLRPFLFDESDADLIRNAKLVIPQLITKYKRNTTSQ